jgi:hypothetical protein
MFLVRDNASEFRGEIDAGGFHPSLFGNLLGGCSIFFRHPRADEGRPSSKECPRERRAALLCRKMNQDRQKSGGEDNGG